MNLNKTVKATSSKLK